MSPGLEQAAGPVPLPRGRPIGIGGGEPLVILYRSRHGPARWCAEEAVRSAAAFGRSVRLFPLPRAGHLTLADEAVLLIIRAAEAADDRLAPLIDRVLTSAARDLRRVDCRLHLLAGGVPAPASLLQLLSP